MGGRRLCSLRPHARGVRRADVRLIDQPGRPAAGRDVVGLYKEVGPAWKTILLDSRVLQDFKEVTSQYTAAEITTKREQLRQDTKKRLTVERANAEATALNKKGAAIRRNPEVLQLEAIDKLNPNVTVVYCTGTGSGN